MSGCGAVDPQQVEAVAEAMFPMKSRLVGPWRTAQERG